ncbi:hypothetical protein QF037_008928 [Streptomyces canus]|uniref:hypothetical protein n=1 Tax=Streptomyces canus TaxID=58343 RepID=UPI002784DD9C|nr:hypothetical protein [Streptomyces canus]MDQ0604583.1 hypothetical protein [Streptomyces canus]
MTGQHDELPIPDYDHLSLGALEQRIGSLTTDELDALRRYESEHANRALVMRLLEARLDRPSADTAASSDGGRGGPMTPDPPRGGSKVTPQTAAPPLHPPPHGTPDQPAKPKANRT